MIPDVILIGPIGAGKSTLARLLAETLHVPNYSLDACCWRYYDEIGFDAGRPDCRGEDGMIAERFHVHAIERMLADHRNCVIDFGAGHSVYRQDESLLRVRAALGPYPNVWLILPSPDLDECSRVLADRNRSHDWLQEFTRNHAFNPNEHFLRHPSNFLLAKRVIYTEGKSPEQTRDEILNRLTTRPTRGPGEATALRQEEMIGALQAALKAAKKGQTRSLVLISVDVDGEASCWTRIASAEDSTVVLSHIDGLKQDLADNEDDDD